MPYYKGDLIQKYNAAFIETKRVYMKNQGIISTYGQALEHIAAYIMEGRAKEDVLGQNGFLQQLKANDLEKLLDPYMQEWFDGNGEELDYEALSPDQQGRMREVRDTLQELRVQKTMAESKALKAESTPPAVPSIREEQPRRPRGGAPLVRPAFTSASAQSKVDPNPEIILKNTKILELLAKRVKEISEESQSQKNHIARFSAMNDIQAYVFKEYRNNERVIDLGHVENVMRERYKGEPLKLQEFNKGVQEISSVSISGKLNRKSEYAKMKKEITKIAEGTPPSNEKKNRPVLK